MAKFMAVDMGRRWLSEQGYEMLEEAVKAAKDKVEGNPDTSVEVFERVKTVTSTLKVEVVDG